MLVYMSYPLTRQYSEDRIIGIFMITHDVCLQFGALSFLCSSDETHRLQSSDWSQVLYNNDTFQRSPCIDEPGPPLFWASGSGRTAKQ